MSDTRRIAVIGNPAAKGPGARVAAIALERLRASYDVPALAGRTTEESLDLARACVQDGVDTLVVCGGDGMVHLGLQAVAGTGTRLAIVPAGTGNDLARVLGLPRKDPARAAEVVLAGSTRRIDLARVGQTWYATVLSCGFDAVVNERANTMSWPRGQMRYNLATLAELRVLRPIRYVLDLDGTTLEVEATMVGVANGPSFGGGLRIAEGAELDDGLLDVMVIAPMSRRRLLRLYPKLFRGSHVDDPLVTRHRVRRVSVAAAGIVAYADGERIGPLPLSVEAAPGALRVLVP